MRVPACAQVCRVTRGKVPFRVKRQTGIFVKPRDVIRITGLVSVARCLKSHFFAYGASSFSGRRSMFNISAYVFIKRLF